MGYALVEFTITETGSVEDANTLEGYCSNTIQAIQQVFRPCTMFIKDGKSGPKIKI